MLRFPSTNVKVRFTSLVGDNTPKRVPSPPRTKVLPPLRINIPQSDSNFASPIPSPTGTIRYGTIKVSCCFVCYSVCVCVPYQQSINCIGHKSSTFTHDKFVLCLLVYDFHTCVFTFITTSLDALRDCFMKVNE